jgi:adenosylmethionine---8-amino-7-oxononanoate aminotransferase
VDSAHLGELDRRHVWHPYAPLPSKHSPLPVASAQGACLRLADGRELVDGMASWWCVIHGYRHPALDAAIRRQLDRVAHVMFGGLTHEPAVALAGALVELTPPPLEHVFFADSGSVAVEVAIKMALQYWRGRGRPRRRRLLTLRGGYHGDTFATMALADPVNGMHTTFSGVLAEHVFVDRPPPGFDSDLDERYADIVADAVERHADQVAAVIVEPIVQGAGGMFFYSPSVIRLLRALCDRYDLLLILDEIATGFGRTGRLFASEHAGVTPDILCIGKALTGGYLSLAATMCTPEIAATISAGQPGHLMHGPTYMANPLACAAGLASIELLDEGTWQADVARIEAGLAAALEPARCLASVVDVRVLGAIGVIELERDVDIPAATSAAVARGVWLRPFSRLIYAMPPYVSNDDEVALIGEAMVAAAATAGS